jgi:hypothetical protein
MGGGVAQGVGSEIKPQYGRKKKKKKKRLRYVWWANLKHM